MDHALRLHRRNKNEDAEIAHVNDHGVVFLQVPARQLLGEETNLLHIDNFPLCFHGFVFAT